MTRAYDNSLRRQRATETRERIVDAGAEIIHGFPLWNWRALTVGSVAERAGVSERTVYRHFGTERDLRDAVLARLESEARVTVEGLSLEGLRDLTARMLEYVSGFPVGRRGAGDATFDAATRRQREALLGALGPVTTDWPERDRRTVAAVLDVLWSVPAYEKLVADWGLAPGEAIAGVTWAMGLVEAAVRAGDRPEG